METKSVPRFIIIDDDPINNHICNLYLNIVFPGVEVIAFTNPRQALDNILATATDPPGRETIMLLDINMPVLTGWDVLNKFAEFPDQVKQQFRIYILSSSINSADKTRADGHPLVSGFFEKPLTIQQLQAEFPQYARMDITNT